MPSKQSFPEDLVLDAALDVVRDLGYEALTMRSVAQGAGCSVQPLYSRFGDKESLIKATYDHAVEWVRSYNEEYAGAGCNVFSSVGIAHIRIAQGFPRIFSFLYMSPYVKASNMDELLSLAEQPGVLSAMQSMWGLDDEKARQLYSGMAIYTHGLATLIMAGAQFSDAELEDGTNRIFCALAASVGVDLRAAIKGGSHGC